MTASTNQDFEEVALRFAKSLARHDYALAYALTGREFQEGMILEQMQTEFESILPSDWRTQDPRRGMGEALIWMHQAV